MDVGTLFLVVVFCIAVIVLIRDKSNKKNGEKKYTSSTTSIKSTKEKPKNVEKLVGKHYFKTLTDEDFDYYQFFVDSGYAIDVVEKEVLLSSLYQRKKYPVGKIRSIRKHWETAVEVVGGSGMTNLGVNMRNSKKAKEASGIFISVADIDYPTWQLKFQNEKELDRVYEIFTQFMDGELPSKRVQVGET